MTIDRLRTLRKEIDAATEHRDSCNSVLAAIWDKSGMAHERETLRCAGLAAQSDLDDITNEWRAEWIACGRPLITGM